MSDDASPRIYARKRKSHVKSRGGCRNCKIRRIKCDEAKPLCRRCKSFGVSCTYDRISSELQPFEEAAFSVNATLSTAVSVNQTVLGLLNDNLRQKSPGQPTFRLDDVDLGLLNTFHERSILTLGIESTRYIYQQEGLRLAIKHPFLMHTALALTMMHMRSDDLFSKQTTREVYHWYQGTSLFNRKLADPYLTSSERDAIWMTAALLGCTTLAHIDAVDPEQSWPLKASSPMDLDWLKLSNGKKHAWVIADLSRPDSTLRSFVVQTAIDDFVIKTTDQAAFKALPREMTELCNLNSSSTPENNPYHVAGACVGRLVHIKSCQDNILKFFTFLGQMTPAFQHLLEIRDPRAVLIMLWYQCLLGAGSEAQWYTKKRTVVETEAMIYYLERYHSHVPDMDKLLAFPKRARFGKGLGALARPRMELGLALYSIAGDQRGDSELLETGSFFVTAPS
ncbi:hypothetical protein CONLIGDRAFT_712938 [Coniochaeta ligniaria NRRL 30616]|uniref:Zn(2)-C6 fungal-type domain-containing protein n=1 Tax=Coniochaeta ligniaria NRRL 30616 TaxID=1408157 RepID=A0A1J7IYT7_9PEZI|nr:hypothetical protein CONLIGDRAFT_712938 [Coniochaeta ligniaria NRRL 30616]